MRLITDSIIMTTAALALYGCHPSRETAVHAARTSARVAERSVAVSVLDSIRSHFSVKFDTLHFETEENDRPVHITVINGEIASRRRETIREKALAVECDSLSEKATFEETMVQKAEKRGPSGPKILAIILSAVAAVVILRKLLSKKSA